jgi:hypothetical protein
LSEVIAEYVDRLCTIEMRPGSGNIPRGIVHRLYAAARPADAPPLTLSMARALIDHIEPGDRVLILTGAGGPPVLPCGEVDGPLGAAALARALHHGCGAEVCILTEERTATAIRAACWGAGLNFRRETDPPLDHAVTFIPMPIDDDLCREQAGPLLDRADPAAVIAVEKLSPNECGVIHGATGLDYTDVHAKPQYLFAEASRRGILTAGIGDNGNEVGFGGILDAVRSVMPAGESCDCPCKGGSAAAVATDHFVVAAISNWGAYGVVTVMSHLLGRSDLLIDTAELERMLRGTVDAGAFDAVTARPTLSDDGVPIEIQASFVTMLRGVLELGLSEVASPGH